MMRKDTATHWTPERLKERGKKPQKSIPKFVGLMLLAVFVLGMINATLMGITASPSFGIPEGNTVIAGNVYNQTGAPLGGVVVTIGKDSLSDTTNQDGYFLFEDVALGNYDVTANVSGYKTIIKRITCQADAPSVLSFYLEEGTGEIVSDERSTPTHMDLRSEGIAIGIMFTLFSLAALVGWYFSHVKKNFLMALGGAVVGTLSYGFLVGTLLSLAALVLILIYRKDFLPTAEGAEDERGYMAREELQRGAESDPLKHHGVTSGKPTPAPKTLGEDKSGPVAIKGRATAICGLCDGKVDMSFPHLECGCGAVFHKICAEDGEECPGCGGQLA